MNSVSPVSSPDMARRRIYLDTGILILASRATDQGVHGELTRRALDELNQDEVDFLYSRIVELETLPQPTVHKYSNQIGFLKDYFRNAELVICDATAQNLALQEACKGVGLRAADALHVACAVIGKADELVTAEKPSETLPKATALPVRTIFV